MDLLGMRTIILKGILLASMFLLLSLLSQSAFSQEALPAQTIGMPFITGPCFITAAPYSINGFLIKEFNRTSAYDEFNGNTLFSYYPVSYKEDPDASNLSVSNIADEQTKVTRLCGVSTDMPTFVQSTSDTTAYSDVYIFNDIIGAPLLAGALDPPEDLELPGSIASIVFKIIT
jgi:hypothetical protein